MFHNIHYFDIINSKLMVKLMNVQPLLGYGDYSLKNNFTVEGYKRSEQIKIVVKEALVTGLTAAPVALIITASVIVSPLFCLLFR